MGALADRNLKDHACCMLRDGKKKNSADVIVSMLTAANISRFKVAPCVVRFVSEAIWLGQLTGFKWVHSKKERETMNKRS